MITVEQSKKNTELILSFCNIFREKPITLEEYQKEREKERKEKIFEKSR